MGNPVIFNRCLIPGSNINCNIFSYDYSGYGASSGRPSEKNLYADIEAAWNFLRTKYGVSPENIILYGQVRICSQLPIHFCSGGKSLNFTWICGPISCCNEPRGQLTSNRWRARLCRKKNVENEPTGQLAIH